MDDAVNAGALLTQQREAVQPSAKLGRPSKYTPEIAAVICDRLAGGELLSAICREKGMPDPSAVRRWALEDRQGFAAKYRFARDLGYEGLEDELLEAAKDSRDDMTFDETGRPIVNHEAINRSRLRVDAIKWVLGKRLPRIYGERLEQQINGTIEMAAKRPDLSNLSIAELQTLEALMSKAAIAP